MHCMIAWGRTRADNPFGPNDHAQVEAILQPHGFVRALAGAGVLTVADNDERLRIESALTALSREKFGSSLVFLISPPASPTNYLYRGFLGQGLWEPINAKTKQA